MQQILPFPRRRNRRRTTAIVVHRTIAIDFTRDGKIGPADVAAFFTRDPEGVATVVLPGSYKSKLPTIRQWRQTGVPPDKAALAFVPYHFLVDEQGEVAQTLAVEAVGAHAGAWNDRSVAVAAIGPAHERRLSAACLDAVTLTVRHLLTLYPAAIVVDHDEVNRRIGAPLKSCAGPGLPIDEIRERLGLPPPP